MIEQLAQERISEFLAAGVQVTTRGTMTLLSTPFSYPNGESIELAVGPEGDCYVVSDAGTTDGVLAELGVEWSNATLAGAAERIARQHGAEVREGVLRVACTEETLVSAAMAVIQAAQAIAGAAYLPPPRMPRAPEDRERRRVRTRFKGLVDKAGLSDHIEPDIEVRGRSQHVVTVARVRQRPILVFTQSLRQYPLQRAQAVAFEWLDVRDHGVAQQTRAACVYDPPEREANGQLAEAGRILTTYFEAGVFGIAEESRIATEMRRWVGEPELVL